MIYSRGANRRFCLTVWLFAVVTMVFLAWVSLSIGGAQTADAVDVIGELVAALVAAAACTAAARLQRRGRAGWGFLAASSLAWACGEAVWSYYDLVRGVAVPIPSLADVGFLAAVPLTVVGLLAFSGGRYRTTKHLVLLAGEMLAAFAIFFGGWAALASFVSHRSVSAILSPVVGVAYPLGDLVTAAMVVVAFRWATRDRASLGFVLAGILSFTVADSYFAYSTAANNSVIGNGPDTGWVLGYLLVTLGALWAIRQGRHADNSGASTPAWALPSHALVSVGAPEITVQERAAVQAVYLKPGWFTPVIADRMVNATGLLLIVADAGVSLYDLALMLTVVQ
jgi:hypothetical protein